MLYNTKVLPIRSNPVDELGDSDCDGADDFEEIYGLETNPLMIDGLLLVEEVDFLTNNSYYISDEYRDSYDNNEAEWLAIATGNLIFNHMISYDQVYESILIDYFSQFNESQENNSNLDILLEEIKSANTRYKNIKTVENCRIC